MNPEASPTFAYDGFASYATDPDRAVVRDIEILVEGLHQNKLVPPPYRKSLELCVDGSDFRLPLRQKRADGSTQSGIREIVIAYLAQSRHLVVFVGPESKNHIWLNFELVGYPLHSGSPNILWLASERFSVPIGDDLAVRRRLHGHGLLHQPVEDLAAAA